MVGLFLTGGGARGAYQAGVLRGLADLKSELGFSDDPFPWFVGNSAGAINTTYIAAAAKNFSDASSDLAQLWETLQPSQVYRTDAVSLSRIGLSWLRDVSTGSLTKNKSASRMLDSKPLRKLLSDNLDLDQVQVKIEQGRMKAASCTAYNYNQQKVETFYQGHMEAKPSSSPRRVAIKTPITVDHVLASCSIPILFSPVQVNKDWYGDGTLRNNAPLSPMINMGCRNILMVGVRCPKAQAIAPSAGRPPVAKVFGTLLNGLFFDHLDVDIERLKHINSIVKDSEDQIDRRSRINFIHIQPSQDIAAIAKENSSGSLPSFVHYLLGGLGADSDTAELTSYLLFDSPFTKKLTELGFEDARSQKDDLKKFWESALDNS